MGSSESRQASTTTPPWGNGSPGIRLESGVLTSITSTRNESIGVTSTLRPSAISLTDSSIRFDRDNGVGAFGGDSLQRNVISSNNQADNALSAGITVIGRARARVSQNVIMGNLQADRVGSAGATAGDDVCTAGSC